MEPCIRASSRDNTPRNLRRWKQKSPIFQAAITQFICELLKTLNRTKVNKCAGQFLAYWLQMKHSANKRCMLVTRADNKRLYAILPEIGRWRNDAIDENLSTPPSHPQLYTAIFLHLLPLTYTSSTSSHQTRNHSKLEPSSRTWESNAQQQYDLLDRHCIANELVPRFRIATGASRDEVYDVTMHQNKIVETEQELRAILSVGQVRDVQLQHSLVQQTATNQVSKLLKCSQTREEVSEPGSK